MHLVTACFAACDNSLLRSQSEAVKQAVTSTYLVTLQMQWGNIMNNLIVMQFALICNLYPIYLDFSLSFLKSLSGGGGGELGQAPSHISLRCL